MIACCRQACHYFAFELSQTKVQINSTVDAEIRGVKVQQVFKNDFQLSLLGGTMRKLTTKQQAKANEERVNQAFRDACSNISINIFDISKVLAVGTEGIAQGLNDEKLRERMKGFAEAISVK